MFESGPSKKKRNNPELGLALKSRAMMGKKKRTLKRKRAELPRGTQAQASRPKNFLTAGAEDGQGYWLDRLGLNHAIELLLLREVDIGGGVLGQGEGNWGLPPS